MSDTRYLLAHDMGTSGDKSTLFTVEGEFVATRTTGYPKRSLSNGGVEQDPEDWWRAFCASTRALVADVDPAAIVAVGFDGTFPNCLCLDSSGAKLTNAFIWQDVRAAAEAKELEGVAPADWLATFSTPTIGADKTLPKLLWLKRNEPELFSRIGMMFPTSQDFVVWRLTGEAVTERGAASGTRMVNRAHDDWSDEILSWLGVSRAQLPRLAGRSEVVGEVLPEAAAECGLAPGTKVVIGTGDAYTADVGVGLLDVGDCYLTGGTSGGIYAIADGPDGPHRTGGETSASGASLAWLKDVVCLDEQRRAAEAGASVYDLINAEVASAPVGSHGVMFHPHLSGERWPRFNGMAQGSFVGLSVTTTRADLMRSVVEGIAFNMALILDRIREQGVEARRMPIIGGLGSGEVTRQIFADVMDVEFDVPRYPAEVVTMGTAILAGVGAGVYEDVRSAHARFADYVGSTRPVPENVERYASLRPLFDEIYRALEPVYPSIYATRARLSEDAGA